ncbi:dTMP kinase [Pinisolibacter sp.]|uniref:dTMP kinase n=1 Tax=Pinisolibacter sp. TaxID=2172024 RepID=UPI002FDEE47B
MSDEGAPATLVTPPPHAGTRGRFITFEGGEGAGKSSRVAELAERLRRRGLEVVVTREPGGSPGAEAVRHVLLSGAAEAFGPLAEAILFAAARADHVDQTIRPALERGAWVISDRFYDSTRVYQGATGDVPADHLAALEEIAVDDVRPDLTILLDVPAEIGMARAATRRGTDTADRFEKEEEKVHERRRRAFLTLARGEPKRFVVIDASQDPVTVADAVWYGVCSRLGLPEKD